MNATQRPSRTHRILAAGGAVLLAAATLAGCTTSGRATAVAADTTLVAETLWESATVHEIDLEVDEADLEAVLQTYLDTGEKAWVSADVVLDGVLFENVGLKLKGNSSLRGISTDTDPATMPWIIRLDKYVDNQTWDGWSELVIRGSSTATSLNEAIALGLLAETGLAAQSAIASSVTVNGGDAQLRLVVQNPDDQWAQSQFSASTLLYKSESEGTWDYVGDDPASYADAFDQEAGDDDLTPLIEFLKFVNESDDATFAAELPSRLDVESFATYLAFQDLVQNTDDIDGMGNNSYLAYEPATGVMTVVNWDLNLAFGASPGAAGPGAAGPGGGWPGADQPAEPPTGMPGGALPAPPAGQNLPDGPVPAPSDGAFPAPPAGTAPTPPDGTMPASPGSGFAGLQRGNVLADRFRANEEFAAMIDDAAELLEATLIDSGFAADLLAQWTATLIDAAAEIVPEATIHAESAQIAVALGIA